MQMPTIYGAPAHMVVTAVVLSIVYVVLVVRFVLHMRGLNVSWSGKKHKTVLILGPRNAGKTQFFHAIRDGEIVETVSSMKELSASFPVHPKYNAAKFDADLNVVDFPGHERLRSRVSDFYPIAGCIVFVVDASDSPMLRKAAEYLYDIFSNAKINDLSLPIMIMCNKSEVSGAMSPQAIREALEKELTQLKTTRSSLETEGDDDHESSIVPVGRDGAAFQFDVDAPCEVTFAKASVKGDSLNDVVAFMQKY
uniref:Signal recognition particle receptor subunit beta n=1 Tax=Globisporangium ultimum (strain ATCC 200006 / CBS 805.95 / DAOM BR144) TaxID=431595 RepID=K3WI65_GLOUD